MSVKSIVACVALGLVSSLAASPAAFADGPQVAAQHTTSSQNLENLLSQIRYSASARGVTLKNLSVTQTVGVETDGLHTNQARTPSCTVTANITIAGTGVVVSATAGTCVEAAAMITRLINSI